MEVRGRKVDNRTENEETERASFPYSSKDIRHNISASPSKFIADGNSREMLRSLMIIKELDNIRVFTS
jgi:hypothetical protein